MPLCDCKKVINPNLYSNGRKCLEYSDSDRRWLLVFIVKVCGTGIIKNFRCTLTLLNSSIIVTNCATLVIIRRKTSNYSYTRKEQPSKLRPISILPIIPIWLKSQLHSNFRYCFRPRYLRG